MVGRQSLIFNRLSACASISGGTVALSAPRALDWLNYELFFIRMLMDESKLPSRLMI